MSVRLKVITWVSTAVWALLIVAGIVVPLGLSEPIVLSGNELVSFAYVADNDSHFGPATSSRDIFSFTRMCTHSGSTCKFPFCHSDLSIRAIKFLARALVRKSSLTEVAKSPVTETQRVA